MLPNTRFLAALAVSALTVLTTAPLGAAIIYFNTGDFTGERSGTGEFRDTETNEVLTTVTITTSGGQFRRFEDGTNFINISEGDVSGYTFEFADRVSGLQFWMSNFTNNHTSTLTVDSMPLINPDLVFAENGFSVNSSGLISGRGSGAVQGNGRFALGEADRLILRVTGTDDAASLSGFVQLRIDGLVSVPEPAITGLFIGLFATFALLGFRNRGALSGSMGQSGKRSG